jgi:predicted O-methyltransferase YrrM
MPEFYKAVDGWFDYEGFYEKTVRNASSARVSMFVEIGVWQGKSLIFMAELIKELQRPVKLFAIDNWTGGPEVADNIARLEKPYLEIFKENLEIAGCKELVTIIEDDSAKSADKFEDGTVDFAFIDAGHSYEAVSADVAAWWPKIAAGGMLAGHDYQSGWGGVMRAVDEFAKANKLKVKTEPGAVWTIRKA